MDTTLMGRSAVRMLAVVLLAGTAAIGLAACQTPATAPAGPAVAPDSAPAMRPSGDRYAAAPADRLEQRMRRDIEEALLPEPGCILNVVVEHPDGGYHLVCTAHRDG